MWGRKYTKIISFLLTLILCAFSTVSEMTAFADNPQPVRITRTVSTTTSDIGDTFTINYNITGDEIKVPFIKKEIALVLDCSGSMAWDVSGIIVDNEKVSSNPVNAAKKRINIAKAAAKRFAAKFAGTDTKIFVVPYSNYVGYDIFNVSPIYNMSDTNGLTSLETFIDNLNAWYYTSGRTIYSSGSTNTGDAMRHAYYKLLDNTESGVRKYQVLLTDGDPNQYVTRNNQIYYGSVAVNSRDGAYTITAKSDTNTGVNYMYEWARKYKLTDIKSFIIGFADNSTSLDQKLDNVGNYAGAATVARNNNKHYYKALTAEELDNTYSEIADLISDELPFSYMHFSDILPVGVDVDPAFMSTLTGMGFSTQTITYNGSNRVQISGPLTSVLKKVREEADGVVYKIDDRTLSFTVQVVATTDGQKFFEKEVTKIEYTYLLPDGTPVTPQPATNQNEQTVTINLRVATINLPGITVLNGGTAGTLTANVNPTPPNFAAFTTTSSIISLTDNGNNTASISGSSVGTAQVTANTSSTNGYYAQAAASCNVKVADVSLGDMYILAGCEIPLNITTNGDVSDVSIINVTETGNSGNILFTNNGISGSKIRGVKATDASGVNLAFTFRTSSGSQKYLSCTVHVVDFEVTPNVLNVTLWDKGFLNYSKVAQSEALKNRINFNTPVLSNNNGNIVIDYSTYPNKWEVKGQKLTSTPVTMTVTKTFDCSGLTQPGPSTQTSDTTVTIRVINNSPDIN